MTKRPWWKSHKCKTCKRKIGKTEITAEISVDTLDGPMLLEICSDCARFFEGSAEVLSRQKPMTDEEYEEYISKRDEDL